MDNAVKISETGQHCLDSRPLVHPSKLEILIEKFECESLRACSDKIEGHDLDQLRALELNNLALSRDIARACDDMASILLCYYCQLQ